MGLGVKNDKVVRKLASPKKSIGKSPNKPKGSKKSKGRGRGTRPTPSRCDAGTDDCFFEAMPGDHPDAGPQKDWVCGRCQKPLTEDNCCAQVVKPTGEVMAVASACARCWSPFMSVWRHVHGSWPAHCTSCANDEDINAQVDSMCAAEDNAIPTDLPSGSVGRVCEAGYLVNFNHVVVPEDKITDADHGVSIVD